MCGTCNLGFSCMAKCKAHMVQDHNISADSIPDVADKTSVAVQAPERRKPGRKRKAEQKPPSPTPSVVSVSDSDEEQMTDRVEEYHTSNKRKVCMHAAVKPSC